MGDIRLSSSCQEAIVADFFERFCSAGTMKQIVGNYREICNVIKVKPSILPEFYPILKAKLQKSWKAQAIFRKLDLKYNSKIYNQGRVCPNTRVLVIGAGPCGLRSAIDAQLLGAKVVVIEKRDRMSRNNVLHLWPFVIEDLRNLGAKKFFGKFCAGSIDHISIRQLQHILLKVALLLGVEFHEGVGFEHLIEPQENERSGWRAAVSPSDHPAGQYEFDVLIGADGKRNTLSGFQRKEFRGKLAIAITANFINKHSKEEASVQEISGTAFIFNQQFFKDLKKKFSIDLENIVYYKDDTHYFVMTAKKQSLLERNVLLQDYPETIKLLSRENINYTALRAYALDAAEYSTDFKLPNLEFAVNHYGQSDVAVFDFTSMFAAENASKVLERHSHKLLVCLVGDSLLEPFWPTGSGCARGFLSSLDACWAIRAWGMGFHPLAVLAERESIYRILAQTTPQNLNPDLVHYTVDPTTRYTALNKSAVSLHQVVHLFNSDDVNAKKNIDAIEMLPQIPAKKRKREIHIHPDTLLMWFKKQLSLFSTVKVENLTTSFKDGSVLCAVLSNYRPDLVEFATIEENNPLENNQKAFTILKQLGILPLMTAQEMVDCDAPDIQTMQLYLSEVFNLFRGEIPAIKHKKLESPEPEGNKSHRNYGVLDAASIAHYSLSSNNPRPAVDNENRRKSRNHRRYHNFSIEERKRKLEAASSNEEKRQQRILLRYLSIEQHRLKSEHMLQTNTIDNLPHVPFEDADLILYRQNALDMEDRIRKLEKLMNPDHRSTGPLSSRGTLDDNFSNKVKNMEDQFRSNAATANKKPKDLLRAIGKIETTDWNLKEIEKKIHENRMGKPLQHERAKVPKWNREQFLARQTRIVEHGNVESTDGKFHNIDSSLKQLDRQLKEGNVLKRGQRGKNKVASLLGQFTKNNPDDDTAKSSTNSKSVKLNIDKKPDLCHVCKNEVYLMEKISLEEGLILHKSCFKCNYCSTMLKIGSYSFDRDGKHQHNIFCPQHFGLSCKPLKPAKTMMDNARAPDAIANYPHSPVPEEVKSEIFNRDQTPERIEIESQTDAEDLFDEMDEDEWTDRNFGTSVLDEDTSGEEDDESSSEDDEEKDVSGSDSQGSDVDSGDYCSDSSEEFSCHEYSSGEDDGASGTWGSEQQVALAQRRQEVALQAPPPSSTPTDTEVASESSSKNSEAANSATEVSTDSEFAHDDPTPTCEMPFILFNDQVKKKKESHWDRKELKKNPPVPDNLKTSFNNLAKVQVPTKIIINGNNTKNPGVEDHVKLQFNSIVPTPKVPIITPKPGDYLLSRTQSTSGIATKRALELKKKYLLGPQATIGLQKSDSASELDSKFRAFHSNISECQKLLNPASDISPSMQAFLNSSSRRNNTTLLSPTNVSNLPAIAADALPSTSPSSSYLNSVVNNTFINKIEIKKPECKDSEIAPMPDIVQTSLNNNIKTTFKQESSLVKPSQSPVFETSIVVPKIPWKTFKKNEEPSGTDIDSDSLHSLGSSSEDLSGKQNMKRNISVPRVEIMKPCGEVMQLDSLMVVDGQYIGPQDSEDEFTLQRDGEPIIKSDNSNIPLVLSNPVVKNSPVVLLEKTHYQTQAFSSSDSGNDITAFLNEPLDWAVEGADSDTQAMKNSSGRTPHSQNHDSAWKALDNFAQRQHVCGKSTEEVKKTNILNCDHSDIDFMDTGSEESLIDNHNSPNKQDTVNTGFIEFVDTSVDDIKEETPRARVISPVEPMILRSDSDNQKKTTILNCDHSSIDFMDSSSASVIDNQNSPSVNISYPGFIEFIDSGANNHSNDDAQKSPLIEAVNQHCDSPVNDRSINFIEQGACILNNDQFMKSFSRKEEEKPEEKINNIVINKIIFSSIESDPPLEEVEIVEQDNQVLKSTSITSLNISDVLNKINPHQFSLRDLSPKPVPPVVVPEPEEKEITKKILNSPSTTRKLEEISKEKVKQKDLIHQLVMDKMSKITERRDRRSRSPITSQKAETPDFAKKNDFQMPTVDRSKSFILNDLREANKKQPEEAINRDLSKMLCKKHSNSFTLKQSEGPEGYAKVKHTNHAETFSLPDIHQSVNEEKNLSDLAAINTLKKRMMSEESSLDIAQFSHPGGIVPGFRQLSLNDFSGKLVQHVESLRNSSLNNDSYQQSNTSGSLCTSDPNLLSPENGKKSKRRDMERRKSIIKTVSDFFSRRRDSTGHSSNPSVSEDKKYKFLPGDKMKRKSNNEDLHNLSQFDFGNEIPPPIPPLPSNYFSGQSTSGHDSYTNMQKSPNVQSICVPKRNKRITGKKRCNSLNEIKIKINETEKCIQEIENMRAQAWRKLHSKSGEEKSLLNDCLCLDKYLENLIKQRNTQTLRAHELQLEARHDELRMQLRDLLNGEKDINNQQEKAIIDEMLAIVTERQAISSSKRLND